MTAQKTKIRAITRKEPNELLFLRFSTKQPFFYAIKDLPKKNSSKNNKNLKKQETSNNDSKNRNSNSRDRNNSEENEFIEKLVSINRVAKVVKGGRRFSFSALVVVGDGKGMVGYGLGKATEVPTDIKKAMEQAKKSMIKIPLLKGTIVHEILGKYGSGKVFMKPASSGTGIIAGGAVRAVLEVAGVKNILTKSLGSNNPHNVVKATLTGLKMIKMPEQYAYLRDKNTSELL